MTTEQVRMGSAVFNGKHHTGIPCCDRDLLLYPFYRASRSKESPIDSATSLTGRRAMSKKRQDRVCLTQVDLA